MAELAMTFISGYRITVHTTGNTKPRPDPPADVPLSVFKAAIDAGATHLSADGQRAYCTRYGGVFEAEWDGDDFGSWWVCDGLPDNAVEIP